VRITNQTRETLLASDAREARSFASRLVGLLGRSSLEPGEGLVIDPCTSVHTAFMRFAIDVLYVNRDGEVIKVVPDLKPFRLSAARSARCYVIELPSGTASSTGTVAGDKLSLER
jgi:uncharacterized membrane protein (UPF0127 family)